MRGRKPTLLRAHALFGVDAHDPLGGCAGFAVPAAVGPHEAVLLARDALVHHGEVEGPQAQLLPGHEFSVPAQVEGVPPEVARGHLLGEVHRLPDGLSVLLALGPIPQLEPVRAHRVHHQLPALLEGVGVVEVEVGVHVDDLVRLARVTRAVPAEHQNLCWFRGVEFDGLPWRLLPKQQVEPSAPEVAESLGRRGEGDEVLRHYAVVKQPENARHRRFHHLGRGALGALERGHQIEVGVELEHPQRGARQWVGLVAVRHEPPRVGVEPGVRRHALVLGHDVEEVGGAGGPEAQRVELVRLPALPQSQ
mmetsp:Transcript_35773/g.80559  ORF Transcript_35773/g.80559 Transcript_35773/m.80559 type:complete len:307 (-) Transcript_35773:596-1516(-)